MPSTVSLVAAALSATWSSDIEATMTGSNGRPSSESGGHSGFSSEVPFEEALARLEKIVERLQRDDVPLDEAVELFKEGTQLVTRSDELLSTAELRIQELTKAVHERFVGYQAESSGSDDYDPLA